MFAVEISKGENIAIEDDTPEVAYHLFRIICLLQGNPGPQSSYDEVNVAYMYYGIIIAVDIRAYFKTIAIVQLCDVVELVELMVAHTGYYLLVVLRCPVPEGMFGIVVIPQVAMSPARTRMSPVTCRGFSFRYRQLSANSRWRSDAYCIFMTVLWQIIHLIVQAEPR